MNSAAQGLRGGELQRAVEALRVSLWATWGGHRRTTDWPTYAQLTEALEAALATVDVLLVPPGEVGLSLTREEAERTLRLALGNAEDDGGYPPMYGSTPAGLDDATASKLSTALTPDEQEG